MDVKLNQKKKKKKKLLNKAETCLFLVTECFVVCYISKSQKIYNIQNMLKEKSVVFFIAIPYIFLFIHANIHQRCNPYCLLMGRVMRKPDICPFKNKCADQLISAFVFAMQLAQSLWKIRKFKLSAFCFDCTSWIISDLFGNPEDQFCCEICGSFDGLLLLLIML